MKLYEFTYVDEKGYPIIEIWHSALRIAREQCCYIQELCNGYGWPEWKLALVDIKISATNHYYHKHEYFFRVISND